jgi:hypothetical protein
MSNEFYFKLKKQTTKGIIRSVASHNLREMYKYKTPPLSIDPSKSHLNVILKGATTAQGVNAHAEQLMKNAGIKIRANAVRGIEIIFSLPHNTQINLNEYFSSCAAWSAKHFLGQENIISAVVHLDQAFPHCHVLILPIWDKRLKGSDMVGNKGDFQTRRKSFYKEVMSNYPLQTSANRLLAASKHEMSTRVLRELNHRSDVVLSSQVWDVLRVDIERNPMPYFTALGIQQTIDSETIKPYPV